MGTSSVVVMFGDLATRAPNISSGYFGDWKGRVEGNGRSQPNMNQGGVQENTELGDKRFL